MANSSIAIARSCSIGLCLTCLVLKTYARYWLLQPIHKRPALTRQNEGLKFMDFIAWTLLSGSFFFLLIAGKAWYAPGVALGFVLYDFVIRQVFLLVETRRLCASSRRWQFRHARRHVLRRAQTAMFN